MFDPYSEGIQWLCYAVGDIMLAWFRSACWGKGYYKTKQSCSDHYPMMKHFYSDGSGVLQDGNAPIHKK